MKYVGNQRAINREKRKKMRGTKGAAAKIAKRLPHDSASDITDLDEQEIMTKYYHEKMSV